MKKLKGARVLGVYVSETYGEEGNQKRRRTRVGAAWLKETSDGTEFVSLIISPGIAVSGELTIWPPSDEETGGEKGQQPKNTGQQGRARR